MQKDCGRKSRWNEWLHLPRSRELKWDLMAKTRQPVGDIWRHKYQLFDLNLPKADSKEAYLLIRSRKFLDRLPQKLVFDKWKDFPNDMGVKCNIRRSFFERVCQALCGPDAWILIRLAFCAWDKPIKQSCNVMKITTWAPAEALRSMNSQSRFPHERISRNFYRICTSTELHCLPSP